MAVNKNDLRLASALLVASGACVLGHQILWTRRLTDLLGANAESSTRVFECFFLGLALGSAFASRLLPKVRRPWRLLGGIEFGVALLCLPVLLLPEWTSWIWPALGPERLLTWPGVLVKLLLCVLLLIPPTFLMGMSLPVMVSAVCLPEDNQSPRAIRLYAMNTLGGVLGLAFVVGIGLQIGGAIGAMLSVAAVNLLVAAKCLARDRAPSPPSGSTPKRIPAPPERIGQQGMGLPLLLAFCSGAGVLALEVLSLQMIDLSAPLAFYPPAAVLFCVILLLAISASLVPRVAQRFGGAGRILPACLAGSGLAIALIPVVFMSFSVTRSAELGMAHSFAEFLAEICGVTLLALGPAVLLAGTVFPLTVSLSVSGGGERAGRKLALLLAINGFGGVVGAELGYRLLLPSYGVHVAIGVVGVFYGLLALSVLLASRARQATRYIVPIAAGFVTLLILTRVLPELPLFFWADGFKVIEVRSGQEGTLAVFEREGFGRAMSFNNQYLLGSSGAAPDMQRETHLPLLLHAAPERVAFVGLGTGITAAGALRHKAVGNITALELCSLVADAAAKHFHDFNEDICRSPKAQVYVGDARTYVAAARGRFDVIVGDLFTPWRPGESRICSLEQFRAAKDALRPGGVFCQWLPMHQLTPEQFDMIAAAFQEVFPEVHLFRNHLKTQSIPLALVGFKDRGLDWTTVARRCDFEREQGRVFDPLCRHAEGVAMLYLGKYSVRANARDLMNTLGNLHVELSAATQLLTRNPEAYFSGSGVIWFKFMQRQLAQLQSEGGMPDSLRSLPQLGFLTSEVEAAAEAQYPALETLKTRFRSEVPRVLLSDTRADWSLWAGSGTTSSLLPR